MTKAPEIEGPIAAMFIEAFVGSSRIMSVLIDGGLLIDLMSAKLVAALEFPVFTGEG